MSLNKSIQKGYEKRRAYTGAKAIDHTCRNHGSCPACKNNRRHSTRQREAAANFSKVSAE